MSNADIRAQAAKRLLELRDAEESFLGFVKLINPTWQFPKFQLDLIDRLDRFGKRQLFKAGANPDKTAEPIRNLLVTMPPRHAKSAICTVLFPAWFMARDPRRFILSTSYNAILAADFGRQVREIVSRPDVHQAFPDLTLAQDSRAADVWRTELGGAYFGIGVGGTTTGRPANLLIIDDPIKTREDAESITQRKKTWDFYTASLSTRTQPEITGDNALTIVILTRWHPDDLAGRLMRSEDWNEGRWQHINYPAISRQEQKIARSALPESHPDWLSREAAEKISDSKRHIIQHKEKPLWPERFPLEELKRRERLNPRDFASLYQQQPYIEGGNMLKSDWWSYYPSDLNPTSFQQIIITVDTAFKKESTSDFSVFLVAGLTREGDIYILDIIRGRWDFPELRQRLINLNAIWRGRGLRAIYIEDRASGQSLIQELRRESGLAVIPYKVFKDKVSRVAAVTPLVEGGRVFLPEGSKWLDDFIEETVSFPSGSNDDQVDAFTMAIDILSRQHVSPADLFSRLDASNSINSQFGNTSKRWGE